MRIIFLSVCVLEDKCSSDKDFFSHSYLEAQLEFEETVEAEQSTSSHPCPTVLDHGYFVGSPKSPGSELAAVQERIKELEQEVSKLKAERFGLARFRYDK